MLKTTGAEKDSSFIFLMSIFAYIDQLPFTSSNMDIPIQFLIIVYWELYFPCFFQQIFSFLLASYRRLILIKSDPLKDLTSHVSHVIAINKRHRRYRVTVMD